MRFSEGMGEGRLTGLFYTNDLVLCGESEEDLKGMIGRFIEEYKTKGVKLNANKNKVKVL